MSEIKIAEKNIAESIRIILIKKNLNVSKLAKIMKISSTTMYSKLKRGSFSSKDLDDICKALDVRYEVAFYMESES